MSVISRGSGKDKLAMQHTRVLEDQNALLHVFVLVYVTIIASKSFEAKSLKKVV